MVLSQRYAHVDFQQNLPTIFDHIVLDTGYWFLDTYNKYIKYLHLISRIQYLTTSIGC